MAGDISLIHRNIATNDNNHVTIVCSVGIHSNVTTCVCSIIGNLQSAGLRKLIAIMKTRSKIVSLCCD